MTGDEPRNWFADESLAQDPYPYLAELRSQCPVQPTPHHDVVAVTGYEEASEILRRHDDFSACVTVVGPFADFPEPFSGDDVSELIERHRHRLPQNDHMVTMDQPAHTRERALLMRLLTPGRLRENEEFIGVLADQQLESVIGAGRCEFIHEYASPLATLVIAELLGVPEEDFGQIRAGFGLSDGAGNLRQPDRPTQGDSLRWLAGTFTAYIEDRRRNPRDDVMSGLALAKYPDGSTPEVAAVVRTATFLFAAGQETSARMLAQAVRHLAEDQSLQDELREHPQRIPNLIEETLRIESPTKTDCRLARHTSTVAGVSIPAGSTVAVLLGAANHDPRKFPSPDEFQADRPNARQHLAFGRGIHTCPGSPLARAEGRITIERLLRRTRNIRLSETHHGPAADRRFSYEPTWMLRAMEELHIEFDPCGPGNTG
ncbi:cytochrome P450 [Trebonia kvetii]|uniref:Cytochrome P450 n=1 Tax=Trebonia kvetii TaxID=2480626 RepID=A0A6P2BTW6_9ACTN|nr:cytochrome P450 [Trebonia kvetii]TVZ02430.1 cytochrome P450 [Trebonia kvetii]